MYFCVSIVNHKEKNILVLIFSSGTSQFAGVHDSFWTHACDVEKMNLILREKFVELYNMPILENASSTQLLFAYLFMETLACIFRMVLNFPCCFLPFLIV